MKDLIGIRQQEKIFNHVRGLYPHPGTFTTYNGQVVKIYKGEIHNCPNAKEHHKDEKMNGTIVKIFKDAIGVKVEDGVFIITEYSFLVRNACL